MVKLTWYFAEHFEWGGDLESTYQSYSSIVCAIRVFAKGESSFLIRTFYTIYKIAQHTHTDTLITIHLDARNPYCENIIYTKRSHQGQALCCTNQPTPLRSIILTTHTHTHRVSTNEHGRCCYGWCFALININCGLAAHARHWERSRSRSNATTKAHRRFACNFIYTRV